MKIVLVGYMGSGKSTVGRLLAQKSDMKFLDLDEYIEGKLEAGITDIFKEKGEIYFRKKEHELLQEVLAENEDVVVATGGGTPCYSGNMHTMLKESGGVFYLKVSIPELVRRLFKEKDQRPLIRHLDDNELPEFIGKHMFERSPFYSMASHSIDCDHKEAEDIADEINVLLS